MAATDRIITAVKSRARSGESLRDLVKAEIPGIDTRTREYLTRVKE